MLDLQVGSSEVEPTPAIVGSAAARLDPTYYARRSASLREERTRRLPA